MTSYNGSSVHPWVNGKVVGNMADASAVVALHHKRYFALNDPTNTWRDYERLQTNGGLDIGERGVSYISEGAMRCTYVDRYNKVVYKVVKSNTPIANISEYERMCRVWKADPSLRKHTTPVSLFIVGNKPVIAMKFVPNEAYYGHPKEDVIRRACKKYERVVLSDSIADMHGGNWRIDGRGTPKFTDLGDVLWDEIPMTGFDTGTATRKARAEWSAKRAAKVAADNAKWDAEKAKQAAEQAKWDEAMEIGRKVFENSGRDPKQASCGERPCDVCHPVSDKDGGIYAASPFHNEAEWTCGQRECQGFCDGIRARNRANGFKHGDGRLITFGCAIHPSCQ